LKTIGIVALAAIAALVLGFGARLSAPTAHAEAEGSVVIGCEFLLSAIDGNVDNALSLGADVPDACFDGIDAADVRALAGDADGDGTAGEAAENGLGDNDGTLEVSDFDDIDLDANQITDGLAAALCNAPLAATTNCDGETVAFAFVDNDNTVHFDPETGVTVVINNDGSGGEVAPGDDANAETCDGDDDLDCGTTTSDNGDGVVVATIIDGSGDPGDTIDLDILQNDDTNQVSTQSLNIVGDTQNITLDVLKNPIQTSGDAGDVDDCTDESDVSDSSQLTDLNRTFLKATVTDDDDVELTRVGVAFEVDDDDIGTFDTTESAEPASDPKNLTGVSVDAGPGLLGSFLVLCGGTDTGTVTVTATANGEDADAEVDVVGAPDALALTVSPAAIDCNGTSTATVSATVTDADGNNVTNGNNVNFSVVALGTANPINADTTAGVATSTITPLSGAIAGVTVIVTAGDAQASIRIDCNTPAAATATPGGPGATPTRGGTIGGPDTGNGGYADQDSAGFPMWTLVALALGSLALVSGGMVTRRIGK
jgi:hypothetical protein